MQTVRNQLLREPDEVSYDIVMTRVSATPRRQIEDRLLWVFDFYPGDWCDADEMETPFTPT